MEIPYHVSGGEMIIYPSAYHGQRVAVRLTEDMIWLTQAQMALLFDTDRSVITKHLKNVFSTGELNKKSNVQKMHIAHADRPVSFYRLDAIISVGYRVNSKRATQFRIWATAVLRDHLLKGFTVNNVRLQERGLKEFEQAVTLIRKAVETRDLSAGEARGLLDIITGYAQTWLLLQQYDAQAFGNLKFKRISASFDYTFCVRAIAEFKAALIRKREASSFFGQEREHALARIIGGLTQTFNKKLLYPSIEEKAAHLLYFIIKDHPFVDGNKRVASFLFIVFLARHKHLFKKNGEKKINDNTLVALALLIAESDPQHKELMVRLVMNFLVDR